MTNTNAVNPDGPYPRENLIQHPEHGELVPVAELLDDIHASVRAQEIIRQHEDPKTESRPLTESEATIEAGLLLSSLEGVVKNWDMSNEKVLADGQLLRNYTMTLDNIVNSGYRSISAQLIYGNPQANVLVYGNAAVVMSPDGADWPREFYFQVSLGPEAVVYSADYPWHEEELARPERNTDAAITNAEHIISQLPHAA